MARLLCLRPCVLLLVLACICTGLSTVQGSNSTATLRYTGSCKQKDYSEDEYSNDKGYGDEYSGNGDDDAYGGRRHDDDSDDGYGRNGNDYPYSKLQALKNGSIPVDVARHRHRNGGGYNSGGYNNGGYNNGWYNDTDYQPRLPHHGLRDLMFPGPESNEYEEPREDGQACITSFGCCSKQCSDSICCPQTRRVTGSACMYSFHCCSGNCQLGKCCRHGTRATGATCTTNSQCCSGTCTGGTTCA